MICSLLLFTAGVYGQTSITVKQGEKWYGGVVTEGHLMPFKAGYSFDMYGNTGGNQAVPLLISTRGRFIWSEEPFKFTIQNNILTISNAASAVIID